MTLTLEVTGPQAAALGDASRKVFDAAGGTIGRLADNTWALPDPYVSSRHAVIRYRDGTFYIEDTSTNGIFINSPDNQLVKGRPHPLQSGDWVFIEPYEIRASISSGSMQSAGSPFDDLFAPSPSPSPGPAAAPFGNPLIGDPFGEPFSGAGQSLGASPGSNVSFTGEPIPDAELDPLNLLGFDVKRPPQNVPSAVDLARNSVLSEHYQPPRPIPDKPSAPPPLPGGLIPDDYNPLGSDDRSHGGGSLPGSPRPVAAPAPPPDLPRRVERRPAPAGPRVVPPPAKPEEEPKSPSSSPPPAASRASRGDGDLAAMLAGAGLENVSVTPELASSFGRILRVVVGGVMDVLQARQRIKSEFRMGMTTFKPADNNPLKFSANVDDALHNLLVKRNAAFLGPVEAFEDAFDDVRNHQMAMLAGLRVAFEAMLAEFDPDRLQEEFDRQLKKGALLSVPAKLRYWDMYQEKIRDMVKDPEVSFRELFGDEFAKAYEEQLRRLKAQGRPAQG